MPCDYRDYPPHWRELRASILERAGHCCEECGVPNHELVFRDSEGAWWPVSYFGWAPPELKLTRIVLTIAHTCHEPACDDPEHLLALCQKHHLALDSEHHARRWQETRRRKMLELAGFLAGVHLAAKQALDAAA